MTSHGRLRAASIAIAIGVLAAYSLIAHPAGAALSRKEVEIAVAEAQDLAKSGAWSKIDRLLRSRLSKCASGAVGLDCRPLINYTWAYLREQQARRDPQRQDQLLGEAEDLYQRVLDDVPGHGPTLNNLALINWRKGNFDRAVSFLQTAIDRNPDARADYSIALGNLYLERRLWDDALRAYEQAAEGNSKSPLAVQGMVDAYRSLPLERLNALIEGLPSWESASPEAASAGYRLVIERFVSSGDRQVAERALLAWTSLLARQRWLTAERVNDLYLVWRDTPVDELRKYMEQVEYVPGWWRERPERRQAITEASIALGQTDISRSEPRAAELRWSRALVELAPDPDSYYNELRGYPLARLDLQTELAALYHQYPDLDENNKFQNLISDIFQSKFEAYKADDLVAIQRHHTVLGTIYAEEPRRESSSHSVLNAVFQLHSAIAAADRRFENGEPYQPLPRLKEMLAAACEKPSPIVRERAFDTYCRTPNGESAVTELYLNAAEGYLDTDELDRASLMLDNAANVGVPSYASGRFQDLGRVLVGRKAVEQITEQEIRGDAAAPWRGEGDARWIAQGQLGAVPDDFARRQRFKALSDYAEKVGLYVDESPAAQRRLEDVRPLLSVATQKLVLAGTADELRLEGLRSLGVGQVQFSRCPGAGHEDVLWMQHALKEVVAPMLVPDGQYGRQTAQAIRAFQAKYGLAIDGVAGDATKTKLRELLCK